MTDFAYTVLGLLIGLAFFVAHLALSRRRAWDAGYAKGLEHGADQERARRVRGIEN